MDPLTALSLAGTIVQFVDFGKKLLTDCRDLYRSTAGVLDASEELELVTLDLHALAKKLRNADLSAARREEQATFNGICDKAAKVAEELLSRLDGLKVKGSERGKWQSFKQAATAAWSLDEVKSLEERLSTLRKALETHVLFSIRESVDIHSVRAAARFDSLDQQTQQIITSLVTGSKMISQQSEILSEIMTTALAQLVSRLEVIYQSGHRQTREAILRSQRGSDLSGDIMEITARVEMLDVSRTKESKLRTSVQTHVLKSLRFPEMTNRYENVLEAYPNTFEWAFRDSTKEQLPWNNLARWLKEGYGIYWISGKSGSGKSTLMKHVFDDARTRQYLEYWAQKAAPHAAPLCLATFFFWNSGSFEQKSQGGMLRTLLCQVLDQYPDLLPVIFPERWARAYSRELSDTPHNRLSWSLHECIEAFKALLQQSSVPLKVCLLIDGLDECNGDHDDLAELCKNMTKTESQGIKICLSSRPWVVFQDSFRTYPKLRLQDLTYGDIDHYVSDKFRRNTAFQRLMAREPDLAPALIKEIAHRADGVFLWVRLVVKSLLDGIRNRDAMPDLLRRLRQIPRELEPLYQHLLGLIDPIYMEWASAAFEIVRAARDLEVSPFGKSIGGKGVQPVTLLAFHLAMNRDINTSNVEHITETTLSTECQDTAVHITARCCGLLEISQLESMDGGIPGQQSLVQFFHLTVREFFEKRAGWPRLQGDKYSIEFEPHFALLRSHALLLGTQYSLRPGLLKDINNTAYSALIYAYHADIHADIQHTQQVQLELLAYVGRIVDQYFSFWHDTFVNRIRDKAMVWEDILSEVFRLGPNAAGADYDIQVSYLRIAKVLLSSGADPKVQPLCGGIGRISALELLKKHMKFGFPKEAASLLIELNRQLDSRKSLRRAVTDEQEENPRVAKRRRVCISETVN